MLFIQTDLPPVSDAFLEGKLEMAHKIVTQHQTVDSPEAYVAIISVLSAFFLVFFFYNVRDILRLLPVLLGTLSNKNICLNIEHISKDSRSRNATAYIMSLPTGMLLGRLELLHPSFLGNLPLGWTIVFTVGFVLAYILLKRLALLLPRPRKIAEDEWKVVQNSWMNYFILGSILSYIVGIPLILLNVSDTVTSIAVLSILGLFCMVNMVRMIQIISGRCSFMTTILYLCAFEIIPTGSLILLGFL